jgi:hypothetical protein
MIATAGNPLSEHGRSIEVDFLGDNTHSNLDDLHVFDISKGVWTNLSETATGTPPSPRSYHGLTSTGGKLYVFGGYVNVSSFGWIDIHFLI